MEVRYNYFSTTWYKQAISYRIYNQAFYNKAYLEHSIKNMHYFFKVKVNDYSAFLRDTVTSHM